MIRIYFAASLRGSADFAAMRARISFLESLGVVLTRHLASPRTAELGGRTDAAIFLEDQRLLEEADVFIGDFSTPSTGAGFMAARAVAAKKPVLALFREGQHPSAMISGCPEIDTRFFTDERDFQRAVRAFFLAREADFRGVRFRAPKVFLAGPPGSGKGTLGAALSRAMGAPHISTGELLRELVQPEPRPVHPERSRGMEFRSIGARPSTPLGLNGGSLPISASSLASIAEYMKTGQLVPAELMRDLVLTRLRQPDCRLFGFILDGYPPSREDLANLTSAGITPDLVCYLDCGDATAARRQVTRAARSTDTPEKAQERLAVFHRAEVSFEALATAWYPDSVVMRVDAEQPAAAVEATVLETVGHLFGDPRREHSFFPVSPFRPESVRSTRVHFHVDAPDAARVAAIARRLHARHKAAQGQVKHYPIASLHLGPQVATLPIYGQLPNFHAFEDAESEAFLTGRLGDGDDALMRVVLEETRAAGGMAELEEYLGEWTLRADGTVVEDSRYDALPYSGAAFAEFESRRCSDIPSLELHLGFDAPKVDGQGMPIPFSQLMDSCSQRGMQNGGWFVFKKDSHWAYRSNEFSSEPVASVQPRLVGQARALREILVAAKVECDVSFSLERVHGIWTF
ncbi:MAG: nucleoside monophosphate kinase [Archangium sp.]|nr:nucleoside monophosphate kinase [Archangium sp.]